MSATPENLLILQGGGPTAVVNATLCGAILESHRQPRIGRIFGALRGVEGLLHGRIADLTSLQPDVVERLRTTPGAALGSSRHRPSDDDLQSIIDRLRQLNVRLLLLIGGNGSMHAAQRLSLLASQSMSIIGLPKTIDNDIPSTDRCPGYGSAARYVAQSVRDVGLDARTLPVPVSIFETMGRGAGWLAAASVLGKTDERSAPHLVYLPERPFDIDAFIAAVDRVMTRQGWVVACVSEGIRTAAGQPVYETREQAQRDACDRPIPGDVASFLAAEVSRRLGLRCRSEKPGLCARSSILHVSPQDRLDAETVGVAGVRAALAGQRGCMIRLKPLNSDGEWDVVPLSDVAGRERCIPSPWLDDSDTAVTEDFLRYARPIVGELLDYPPPLC